MDKFKKTFGKMRKPIGRDKFEALTGKSLEKADMVAELKRRIEEETDEEKKKKLKQMAHFQGIALD
jgi:hypothetical protein